MTVRLLLGDTNPSSRRILEPLCRDEGWHLQVVESSFQILRVIRETPDLALVLIDPSLPGSGVSGRDVARTIKASSRFGAVPVLFVTREGQPPLDGPPVNGVLDLERWSPARVREVLRETIGGVASAPAKPAARAEGEPRSVAASPPVAVDPPGHDHPGAYAARIVLADTAAASRSVLAPLFERRAWELIAVESGFQAIRMVRDADVDLVLIDPGLQTSGVSGRDMARAIKGAARSRKLPVLFVLHEGQVAPPSAFVDGTIEVDSWPAARILDTLSIAMGRPAGDLPAPTGDVPSTAEAEAGLRTLGPSDRTAPVRSLRETTQDDAREPVASDARAASEVTVRPHLETEEGRGAASGAATLDAWRPEVRERMLDVARRITEPASQAETAAGAPAILDTTVQQYLASARGGLIDDVVRSLARDVVATLAREIVPTLAREVVATLARDLVPALAREVVPTVAGQVVPTLAGEIVPTLVRDLVLTRDIVPAVVRDIVPGLTRDALSTLAREVVVDVARESVPAVAERLIKDEIARLRSEYRLD
jgi:CheY-like chemotaxis protein